MGTLCRGCTDTVLLLSQDDDDDGDEPVAAEQHMANNDDEKPTVACCPSCKEPTISHGTTSMCPECLEAVRICAETDFSDVDPEEIGQEAEEPTIVSVKTPGKLIQEKFLAACANGDVVDLVFGPAEVPGSPVRALVDVRTPVRVRNPYLTCSATNVQEDGCIPSPLMPISSSTPRSSRILDQDGDEDDCQVLAVVPLADQIQDRIRRAEESGNVILMTASQNDEDYQPEATNPIHSTVNADDDWISIRTPNRKRPAPSSVDNVGGTTSGNPQGGLTPPTVLTGHETIDC